MADAASYPLPNGVTDAVLNRDQLARALGVSLPTIDRWIGDGMPMLQDGRNGRAYQFQLSACWAWKCGRDAEDKAADDAAEDAIRQLRLALTGGSAGDDAQRAMSAKE